MAEKDNGLVLRELMEASGLTQQEALARFNKGQVKPMALRTFKTYLARPDSKTRVLCSDTVLARFKKVVKSA